MKTALIIFNTLIILTNFISHLANAQMSTDTSSEIHTQMTIDEPKPWGIKLDGTSVVLKGFGLSIGRSFLKKLNTSVFYNQHILESNDDYSFDWLGSYEAEHKAQAYGLRADIYPFTSFERGGFYTSLLIVQVNLKTTIDPIGSDEIRTLETQKAGAIVMAGYEFKRGFLKRLSSALNVGLGYGVGGEYSNNLGGTRNEIENSLHLDAAYSFLFCPLFL